jgi:hypothetical protein
MDDISRTRMQVPVLGRKFKLGSLYDAIHEDIIPGKSIKIHQSINPSTKMIY